MKIISKIILILISGFILMIVFSVFLLTAKYSECVENAIITPEQSLLTYPMVIFIIKLIALWIIGIILISLAITLLVNRNIIYPLKIIGAAIRTKRSIREEKVRSNPDFAEITQLFNEGVLNERALREAQIQGEIGHCFYNIDKKEFYDYSDQLKEIFETRNLKESKYQEVENLFSMMLPSNQEELTAKLSSNDKVLEFDFEVEINKNIKSLHSRIKPISWSKEGIPLVLFVTIQDISKRVQTEKDLRRFNQELSDKENQLARAERMATIGRISAGVAHEINNPVSFIQNNLTAMQGYFNVVKKLKIMAESGCTEGDYESLDNDEDINFVLEDIDKSIIESLDGCSRISSIVKSLKTFARPDMKEKIKADINEALQSTLNIANNEIKYHCTVKTDFGRLPDLICYPGELNQVFLNLIVNASQAIKEKGIIEVSTRYDEASDEIVISVCDNGEGIKEDNIRKLFEPFFTTKPPGKGSGLGLSISQQIIEKHKGFISAENREEGGACFIIRLPVTNAA